MAKTPKELADDYHQWDQPLTDTDAKTFIQWKGTDVCIDFYCDCGRHTHFDGYFAYSVRCPCGQIYELGTRVRVRKVEESYFDEPQDLVEHG